MPAIFLFIICFLGTLIIIIGLLSSLVSGNIDKILKSSSLIVLPFVIYFAFIAYQIPEEKLVEQSDNFKVEEYEQEIGYRQFIWVSNAYDFCDGNMNTKFGLVIPKGSDIKVSRYKRNYGGLHFNFPDKYEIIENGKKGS